MSSFDASTCDEPPPWASAAWRACSCSSHSRTSASVVVAGKVCRSAPSSARIARVEVSVVAAEVALL